jgi:hypothetical protein
MIIENNNEMGKKVLHTMLNTSNFFYNDNSRIAGRCHLVLISTGSNPAAGLDNRSRFKSALGGALVQIFFSALLK